jgi:iron complex outermembrane receptor protein
VKKWLGFRAQNAESAEIAGAEISISGEGKIGPVSVLALLGYTYMNPISKNQDSVYRLSFSDTSTNMLKYRFNHLAKADLQLEYKGISIGGSMRLNSYMKNIDAIFEDGFLGQQILPGLKEYREEHQGVSVVFDARIGYTYKEKYKVAFIVNNIANAEYMTRPGDIQAPRAFMLQLSYKM